MFGKAERTSLFKQGTFCRNIDRTPVHPLINERCLPKISRKEPSSPNQFHFAAFLFVMQVDIHLSYFQFYILIFLIFKCFIFRSTSQNEKVVNLLVPFLKMRSVCLIRNEPSKAQTVQELDVNRESPCVSTTNQIKPNLALIRSY